MIKKKCMFLIISVFLFTSFISIFVSAQNKGNSKEVTLFQTAATSSPMTTDISTSIPNDTPSFTPAIDTNATVSPTMTPTQETAPSPAPTVSMESDYEWFALEAKKVSVRVGKTKTIKIALFAHGNCIYHSKRVIKKLPFKFKTNKSKIAKVTKKGVVKGIKKGNAKIKVTLLGADEPRYCKIKVLPKKKRK